MDACICFFESVFSNLVLVAFYLCLHARPALSKPDANAADPAAATAAAVPAAPAAPAAAAATSSGHSLAQFPAFAALAAATQYHDAAVLTVLNLSFLGDMLADALRHARVCVCVCVCLGRDESMIATSSSEYLSEQSHLPPK
jgi:hypothetical protein